VTAPYRTDLPQLGNKLFLTDSGLETWLCFTKGIELPEFAAFPLLDHYNGRALLDEYLQPHIKIALRNGHGFLLETNTWRANADWGTKLGYNAEALDRINRDAVQSLRALRSRIETADSPMPISGNIGPRGDGYSPENLMNPDESARYHAVQIESLAAAGADLVTTLTMTHSGEAAGIALAARSANIPCVISFTTEIDGRLPSGETLREAILAVDEISGGYPAYYMINCAHPDHFTSALEEGAEWMTRLRGVRANASRMSHEELDNSETLDDGDPDELGRLYASLRARFPNFTVLGGCCGTDHRHVEAICLACR